MAKILVADDNSNIQKMVGLALRDQGIEVIAVGNGEAAVRKISELHPHLVLADVFMPVRNGYEVCEYVKTDSKLSHIPVILLVGAFDPLDEQEAQRVGADGVLKKPFVPPDPLISMVKSALQRAGVSLEPEPAAAPEAVAAPPAPKLPTFARNPGMAAEFPLASIPVAVMQESPASEVMEHRAAPMTFPEGAQAPAFESLLGTQEISPSLENEPDANLLVSHHPELDQVRSWNSPTTADPSEEEAEQKPKAWRSAFEAGDEEEAPAVKPNGASDWRETVMATLPMSVQRELEPGREPIEAAAVPAEIDLETAPEALVPEATGQEQWTSPGELAAAEAPVMREETAGHESTGSEAPAGSWFSAPVNPWDAELQKAQQLSETWNAPPEPAIPSAESGPVGMEEETPSLDSEMPSSSAYAAEPAAVETDFAALAAPSSVETPAHAGTAGDAVAGAPAIAPAPAATARDEMDAMVAKVLANLSPEVMQAMTREILKPVVEAMVKSELESKKS